MALKNILVHLDHLPQSPERFDLALAVARKQQAVLTGYYATASPYFSLGAESRLREENRSQCLAKAGQVGVRLDWVENDGAQAGLSLVSRVNQRAIYADLTVVGQPSTESGSPPRAPRDLPERLILASGRPVLTVPFAGTFRRVGERVMVAWKAGRASSRAVADALPFLTHADAVILVSFAATPEEIGADERSLDELRRYLLYHGVEALTEQRQISGIGLGDALLNRVAEEGIDLLVAGGMLPKQQGPMANHILQHMTVPVLMSC